MNTYTQSSIILTEKYHNMKVIDKLLSVNTNLPGLYDDDDIMMMSSCGLMNKINYEKQKIIRLTVGKQLSIT